MTGREQRLTDAGADVRCAYCGWPAKSLTCRAHSDLPKLDPHYNLVLADLRKAA